MPTALPSLAPTALPTLQPSLQPTPLPSLNPTEQPTFAPYRLVSLESALRLGGFTEATFSSDVQKAVKKALVKVISFVSLIDEVKSMSAEDVVDTAGSASQVDVSFSIEVKLDGVVARTSDERRRLAYAGSAANLSSTFSSDLSKAASSGNLTAALVSGSANMTGVNITASTNATSVSAVTTSTIVVEYTRPPTPNPTQVPSFSLVPNPAPTTTPTRKPTSVSAPSSPTTSSSTATSAGTTSSSSDDGGAEGGGRDDDDDDDGGATTAAAAGGGVGGLLVVLLGLCFYRRLRIKQLKGEQFWWSMVHFYCCFRSRSDSVPYADGASKLKHSKSIPCLSDVEVESEGDDTDIEPDQVDITMHSDLEETNDVPQDAATDFLADSTSVILGFLETVGLTEPVIVENNDDNS